MTQEYRSHEEIVAEVLSRFSVADLYEQTNEDFDRADAAFYKAAEINVVEKGEVNLVKFWKIASGDKFYEVRRFQNWAWCSCKSFFFSKHRACKHIAVTAGVYCANCHLLSAKVGKLCYDCDMKINHFLKQSRPAAQASSHSL